MGVEGDPIIAIVESGCFQSMAKIFIIIVLCSAVLGWGCIEGVRYIHRTYTIKVETNDNK